MTTPAPVDIPKKFPWLRTDPAQLSGNPPATVDELLKNPTSQWTRLFQEWLNGATGEARQANFALVGANSANQARLEFREMQKPTGTDEARRARREQLATPFASGYQSFVRDIQLIDAALTEQAALIRKQAKTGKEARRLAGAAVATAVATQQLEEGKKQLGDVNVAIVARVELKKFQVTLLQEFNTALNELSDATWDDPEKGTGIKALSDPVVVMFNAYGNVEEAAAAVLRVPKGDPVPPELVAALAGSLVRFGDAVAGLCAGMAKCGALFGKWAQRTTRTFVADNFASVFPSAGKAFYALRMVCNAASAAVSFLPGYGYIADAISIADDTLEGVITQIVGRQQSLSIDKQQEYALQQFVVKEENTNDFLVRSDRFLSKLEKNQKDMLDAAVDATGLGKAKKALSSALYGLADKAGLDVGDVKVAADATKATLSTGAAGAGVPTSAGGILAKGAELAGRGAPVVGAVLTLLNSYRDTAAFYRATHSVLANRDDVSPEDVALVRARMENPPVNEGFPLFALGAVELVEAGFPITLVSAHGVTLAINVQDDTVTIRDPAMITAFLSKQAQTFLKNQHENGMRYAGLIYEPDWSTFRLADPAVLKPPFEATVKASRSTPAKDYTGITLTLVLDLGKDDLRVTGSDHVPLATGLDGKVRHNAALAAGAEPTPISIDDIEFSFVGKHIDIDGTDYELTKTVGTFEPDETQSWLRFDMEAHDKVTRWQWVTLSYGAKQPLTLVSATPMEAGEIAERLQALQKPAAPATAPSQAGAKTVPEKEPVAAGAKSHDVGGWFVKLWKQK